MCTGGRSRRVPSYRTILNKSCGDPIQGQAGLCLARSSAARAVAFHLNEYSQ